MSLAFVMIFESRNGSSSLVSRLNANPAVLFYPEILVDMSSEQVRAIMHRLVEEPLTIPELNAYGAEARYHPIPVAAKHGASAVGLKVKLWDVEDVDWFMRFMLAHDVRLIYLRRRNILNALISEFNSHRLYAARGIWNAETAQDVPSGAFAIEPAAFVEALSARLRAEAMHEIFFNNFRGEKIKVFYEDMLDEPEQTIEVVSAFLKVPAIQSEGLFFKATPRNAVESVSNLDQLFEALAGEDWVMSLLRYLARPGV